MSAGPPPLSGRWLVLAGGARGAARAHAEQLGAGAAEVLEPRELARHPTRVRQLAARGGIAGVLVSTADGSRQVAPQLLSLAAATVPGLPVLEADRTTGRLTPVSRRVLLRRSAAFPFALAGGTGRCAGEIRALMANVPPHAEPLPRGPVRGSLIAVWLGEAETLVGGSITHVSGILAGFRAAGLRVGLVTNAPPPPQFDGSFDELELAEPLPPADRLTPVHDRVLVNRAVRAAIVALARRFPPSFVYQRNRAYLLAGRVAARELGVPYVLEFNAAETWSRAHWFRRVPGERLLHPLLRGIEVRAVTGSALIAAVSERAAEMAGGLGAVPEQLAVVPNGVDAAHVVAVADGAAGPRTGDGARIGWIGSYGPWHGAEVLIRALPSIPAPATLVMVGDGSLRGECERLAAELGVSDRVEFRGALPHDAALRAMAGCDVLASPHVPTGGTRFFGSPTKLFEYMAIGRPIVASALEQLSDILEHERTAVLVAPGDVQQLARGIERVLQMPDRGAALGAAARAIALREHSWSSRAELILDRLEQRVQGVG